MHAGAGGPVVNEPTAEQQVEQRFNLVTALYGDRLDGEQLAEVRRAVEGDSGLIGGVEGRPAGQRR